MTADLDERVREMLGAPSTLEAVSALLTDLRMARSVLTARVAKAHQTARDPAAKTATALAARKAAEGAAFEVERREAQVEALEALSRQLAEAADQAALDEEREAAEAERDALADRLRERYPVLAAEMVELFRAIRANDDRLTASGIHLESAEARARGCPGNFYDRGLSLQRLIGATLPAFEPGRPALWSKTTGRAGYHDAGGGL